MTDPIADMLIRIKNAQAAKKETASFEYSKIKFEIAKTLESKGYLGGADRRGKKNGRIIEVKLVYGNDGGPRISEIRRKSKLSRRIYKGYREIFPVSRGAGLSVYSTPKGLLTGGEARKARVGGELLFEIW